VNTTGGIVMRAVRVGSETMLAQIVHLVAQAQRSRAPIQALADRVSAWFVPAVLATAALTFVAWLVWGPEPRLAYAVTNAVAVLIIACPCALGLATPMSVMVGVGRGAQMGVLIRNAEAIEKLAKLNTLAVDKTGTLTEGRPKLAHALPTAGFSETELLRLAASLELASEHPLAHAIVEAAREKRIPLEAAKDFHSTTAGGVAGTITGRRVLVGKPAFLHENGAAGTAALETLAAPRQAEGATAIFVAADGRAAGILTVADPVRSTTSQALVELRELGINVLMLTGDNPGTAEAVARKVGIQDFQAGVTPHDKHEKVKTLKTAGRIVGMAGDGINDAPALAAADVGIAMGTGTDIAMESAGVTLVKGDLRGIVRAIRLGRAMMGNIRQNLFFAFVYNALGVPVAAGILYPFFGVLLSPVISGAAMTLSSVSVIGNALRLRKQKL
jgi:Cu+-exporting ATPase